MKKKEKKSELKYRLNSELKKIKDIEIQISILNNELEWIVIGVRKELDKINKEYGTNYWVFYTYNAKTWKEKYVIRNQTF